MPVINIKIILMLGNLIYIRSVSVYVVASLWLFVAVCVFVDSKCLFFCSIYDRGHYAFCVFTFYLFFDIFLKISCKCNKYCKCDFQL
jgi:hypothetical protein